MVRALAFAAQHARIVLVIGLICGLVLQDLAQILKSWIPEMVACLLFLTAFRIGPRAALGSLRDLRGSLGIVLVYQLAIPLGALGLMSLFGVAGATFAVGLLLMLSAPSVTASANLAIILGHDPAPALRILILGTALLPLTVIPVLAFAPYLGGMIEVLLTALRLFAVIAGAVIFAFILRATVAPRLEGEAQHAFDGLSAIALAIIVIGLMSAVGPALKERPQELLFWLCLALGANLGMQVICYLGVRSFATAALAVPAGIIGGNRNFALFFVALPAATTDPLLIFLGCYQFPMYLTPILMRWLYPRAAS